MAAAGNWADLPQELLDEIAKCLTIYADHIRLRAVCVSWRSALPNTPNQLPRQFPLLMFPCNSRGETTYEFFSIAENRSYFLDFPMEMSKKKFLASSCHGWLVIKEDSPLGLFNPFTKAHIELPSICTSYCGGAAAGFLCKVVLSASPSSFDFLAVALFCFPCPLLICRYGDRSWTAIEERPEHIILDVTFYKQQLVTLRTFGEVVIREVVSSHRNSTIDINIKHILRQPSFYVSYFSFLVEYDDDLLVVGGTKWHDDQTLKNGFGVHKLDWNKNSTGVINAEWSEVKSLGDGMYFPDLSPSSYFSACDFPGCRGNCLYFEPSSYRSFSMFDLADKRMKPWPAYPQGVTWEKEHIWITPSPF